MLLIYLTIWKYSSPPQNDKQDAEADEGVINSVEYILNESKGLENSAVKV